MRCRSCNQNCPKCEVGPSNLHEMGCGVERCATCGFQRIFCDCSSRQQNKYPRLPWTGRWPGEVECEEYGFYAKMGPNGWEPCKKEELEARPDLNTLLAACEWNPKKKKYIKKQRGMEQPGSSSGS